MKTPLRYLTPLLLTLCAAILFSACGQPVDLRTTPINAVTIEDYNEWHKDAAQKLSAPEIQEFDDCISEIKLGIMQRKEASGTERIAQAMCDRINGKTFREVLILGYTTTVDWVIKELAFQRTNLKNAEAALNGPGSDTSKAGLRDYYNIARDNIENKLEPKLAKAKARLTELQTQTAVQSAPSK